MVFIKSITTRLLSVVFSFYLVIAVSVTLVHIVSAYQETKSQVSDELAGFHDTFVEGVTNAVWELNQKQLESLITGALRVPTIVGAKVVDKQGNVLITGGLVKNDPDKNPARLFWHQGAMVYDSEEVNAKVYLGEITLYSSEKVVFERVRLGFFFIIVNAIVKTIALWIIFVLVGKKLLSQPLQKLADATTELDYVQLKSSAPVLRTQGRYELAALENSFNQLVKKLHESIVDAEKAEQILHDNETRFRTLASVSPVGIIYTDAQGNCTYINDIWASLTETSKEEALGRGWLRAFPGFDADDIFAKMKSPTAPARLFKREFRINTKNGEEIWALAQASTLKNDKDEVIGFVGTLTDITSNVKAEQFLKVYNEQLQKEVHLRTEKLEKALGDHARLLREQSSLNDDLITKSNELKSANEKLNHLATTDALTGVYNRRQFFNLADKELLRAARYQHTTTILMMDIDHFKQINDAHGHGAGDEALKQFCQRCKEALRTQDVIGRLGGEEFAIFLPETDVQSAKRVAERIRESVAEAQLKSSSGIFQMTVSIGITEAENTERELRQPLMRADEALYHAKHQGRNRVITWGDIHQKD